MSVNCEGVAEVDDFMKACGLRRVPLALAYRIGLSHSQVYCEIFPPVIVAWGRQ